MIPRLRDTVMGQRKTKLRKDEIQELFECTHFSKREIQNWYKGFMKCCPKGLMTVKQFKEMYEEYFDGDASEFASHVFRTFDKDSSGFIDFREFVTSLSITSRGSLDEKLEWAFTVYDVDGDGGITKDEMTEIILAIYRMYGDNLKDKEPPLGRTQRIFQEFDSNQDGVLSMEEFIQGAHSDPYLVLMMQYKPPRQRDVILEG